MSETLTQKFYEMSVDGFCYWLRTTTDVEALRAVRSFNPEHSGAKIMLAISKNPVTPEDVVDWLWRCGRWECIQSLIETRPMTDAFVDRTFWHDARGWYLSRRSDLSPYAEMRLYEARGYNVIPLVKTPRVLEAIWCDRIQRNNTLDADNLFAKNPATPMHILCHIFEHTLLEDVQMAAMRQIEERGLLEMMSVG